MKISSVLFPALLALFSGRQGYAAVVTEDNRMAAFMGNWQACPTPEQYSQYTHVFIAFAVSYTWGPSKNTCNTNCHIFKPPICSTLDANGQTQLVRDMQAAGVKVLLSFGGAGMGGSWLGDPNDCWEYCFGRETQVINQLTTYVNEMGLDGVDIDYEYFYTNNPTNRPSFNKGPEAIHFLSTITSGLKNNLPAGRNMVTHTPMDVDLVASSDYVSMLSSVSDSIDFLMIQFYNGWTRPAIDGFDGTPIAGSMKASTIFDNVVVNVFGGQEHRVVVGFCIFDCGYTGSNADANAARAVMSEVNDDYDCVGGAGFWVSVRDNGGAWSSTVNQALTPHRGCSGSYTPATTTGGGGGGSPGTTTATVAISTTTTTTTPAGNSGGGGCSCPAGYTGYYPVDSCKSFVHCSNGSPSGPVNCQPGLLFDKDLKVCNWPNLVTCECDQEGAPETSTTTLLQESTSSTTTTVDPTTTTSTTSSTTTTTQPITTTSTSTSTSSSTSTTTSTSTSTTVPQTTTTSTTTTSTTEEVSTGGGPCCPDSYSGYYPVDDCSTFTLCVNGALYSETAIFSCANGLLFDEDLHVCNWANQVTCNPSCD